MYGGDDIHISAQQTLQLPVISPTPLAHGSFVIGDEDGEQWTSAPGGSSNPAATVPQYMEVIATGQVSKQGATISGDTPHVVVVKTNPGYGPDPSQPGTGTVVAQVC